MSVLDRLFRRAAPPATEQKSHESGRGHTGGFLRYDEINPKLVGAQGIRKFAEMFRSDADVRKALIMLWAPIAAATYEIEPAGSDDDTTTEEDELVAEFVEWALFERMAPKWAAHLWEIGRVGGRSGFVPFEIVFVKDEWIRAESIEAPPVEVDAEDPLKPVEAPEKPEPTFEKKPVVTIDSLALRLPETIFRWEQDGPHLVAIWQYVTGSPGEVRLAYENVVYYRFGAEGDNWEGESLLRGAYKPWKYKDTLELIDAIAHEKYRIGVPVGYPPEGGGGDRLDDFTDALKNIRANEQSYIVAPGPKAGEGAAEGSGWLIEILQPQGSSEGDSLMDSLAYHKNAIAASVIEEFMRLGQEQVGARATADVQQDPFYLYCEAIAEVNVCDPVNEQLIPRLVGLNFDTDRMPKLRASLIDSTSLEQLGTYISSLSTVINPDDGLEDHLRERANLPPADPVERAKRKAQRDLAAKQGNEAHQAGIEAGAAAVPKPGAPNGSGPTPPGGKLTLSADDPESFLDLMDLTDTTVRLDAAKAQVERTTALYADDLAEGKQPPEFLDALEEHYLALEAHGRASVGAELARQRGRADDGTMTLDFNPGQPRDELGRWIETHDVANARAQEAIDHDLAISNLRGMDERGTLGKIVQSAWQGTLDKLKAAGYSHPPTEEDAARARAERHRRQDELSIAGRDLYRELLQRGDAYEVREVPGNESRPYEIRAKLIAGSTPSFVTAHGSHLNLARYGSREAADKRLRKLIESELERLRED